MFQMIPKLYGWDFEELKNIMTEKHNSNETPKSLFVLLLLIPVVMFGGMGAFMGIVSGKFSPLSGFAWGAVIAIGLCAIGLVGTYGWEWIKKEADKGKLLPFIIVGVGAAIVISGYLAISLGEPSCMESETDNRGSYCTEYADDGYEATSEQKWDKFWSTFPVTAIITSLIAVIVRYEMEKNQRSR